MCDRFVVLVLLAFAGGSSARLAPDFIYPCNNTEPACLIKSTQDAILEFSKGMPYLGVPPLDPFQIEELPIQLPGIKVTFYGGKATGLRKCQVLNVEAYLERNVFIIEVRCNITIRGKYTAVGRLLLFPINGEGDSKIKIVNSIIKLNINTKYYKDKQGRDHFGIKSYKYTFDYGERIHYTISNLFKGNPELMDATEYENRRTVSRVGCVQCSKTSKLKAMYNFFGAVGTPDYEKREYIKNGGKTVLEFLNENWRVVTEEFGQPVVDYAINVTVHTTKKFFDAVPYDELLNVPIPKY